MIGWISSSDVTLLHKLIFAAVVLVAGYFVVLAIRLSSWMKWKHKIRIILEQFPHRRKHWLLGHLYDNPGTIGDVAIDYMDSYVHQFPRGFHYALGPLKDTLIVNHPESIKDVIKATSSKAISNFGAYGFIKQWLGDGLLISGGNKWFRNRKLMTPAFHFDVLRPYVGIKNEAADKLIAKLEKACSENPSVEVYTPVSMATLDVIMQCAFSYNIDDVQNNGGPYVKSVLNLAELIIRRILSPFLYPNWVFNLMPIGRQFWSDVSYVHKICHDIITQRRHALSTGDIHPVKRHRDFLDVLLMARDDKNLGLTDLEIRQEVDTFMFEGHDTTASGISWALHTLAAHPEHQTRAQREVDDLLRGRDPPHLTWDDMSTLPYLTLCIKESLRLTPPVPIVGRELIEDATLNGHHLPAGIHIDISIYGVHHNPTVWGDDHKEYKPDRFLPENINKMDSFSFIPFSAGQRNCIGQNFAMHELKILVARIIHRFNISVDPSQPAEHRPELITRSKDGIRLIIKPR